MIFLLLNEPKLNVWAFFHILFIASITGCWLLVTVWWVWKMIQFIWKFLSLLVYSMIRILGKDSWVDTFLYIFEILLSFLFSTVFFFCVAQIRFFLSFSIANPFVDLNVIVMIFCLDWISQRKMLFIHSIFVSLVFFMCQGWMNDGQCQSDFVHLEPF